MLIEVWIFTDLPITIIMSAIQFHISMHSTLFLGQGPLNLKRDGVGTPTTVNILYKIKLHVKLGRMDRNEWIYIIYIRF